MVAWTGLGRRVLSSILGAGIRIILRLRRRLRPWIWPWMGRLGRLRLVADRSMRQILPMVGRICRALRRSRFQSIWKFGSFWRDRALAWRNEILEHRAYQRCAYWRRSLDGGCRQIRSRANFGCSGNPRADKRSAHDDRQLARGSIACQLVGQRSGGCAFHDSQFGLRAFCGFAKWRASGIVPAADCAPATVDAAKPFLAGDGGTHCQRRRVSRRTFLGSEQVRFELRRK